MKLIVVAFSFFLLLLLGFRPSESKLINRWNSPQEETDTIIWREAVKFTKLFNERDTSEMKKFLPDDFMLQWLHENFLGKESLLNIMRDTAVQSTFKHILRRNVQTIIRYSDDKNSAAMDAAIDFMDQTMMESLKKERSYGLSIMYFQKRNERWWLKTIHLDLHCSLCND